MKNTFFKKIFASTALSVIIMFTVGIFVIPAITSAQLFTQQQVGAPLFDKQGKAIQAETTPNTKQTGCVSSGEEYCLLEPIVINGTAQEKIKIADYVKTMFKIGIGLAALFAVFMIIFGGFQYITSESIGGKGDGKEKIQGALWGLALALGSFLILNTINPQLLEFSGGLKPIDVKRDLATKIPSFDTDLQQLILIGEQAREARASIEALRTRAQTLKDLADIAEREGKTAEATRLRIEAGKATYEETKLYNSSLIKDKYDMAARDILNGGGEKTKYITEMRNYFAKQFELLENANAPQKEIDTLVAKERRLNQQIKEVEQMALFKKVLVDRQRSLPDAFYVEEILGYLYGIEYNALNIKGAIQIMYDSNSETKKIASEIATIDTQEAETLKEFTKNNLKALNGIIKYRNTCPKDFVLFDGKSLGNEIVTGAIQGSIIGGTTGAIVGTVTGGQTIVGAAAGGSTGFLAGGAIATTQAVSSRIGAAMGGQKIPCVAN